MCRLECPANVDIPKLMLEAKAAYVRTNGLPLHDWLLARIDTLAALAGRLPGVANWALANPQARWLLEKLLGIAQGRKLPRLARRSFLQQAAMRRLHHPPRTAGEKVVYFVDTYANHFDTQLAEALGRRAAAQRRRRVRAAGPAAGRHADDLAGRAGAGPRDRRSATSRCWPKRCGRATRSSPPSRRPCWRSRTSIRSLLDDDEDAVLVAQHTSGCLPLSVAAAPARPAEARFPAAADFRRLPRAVPLAGAGRRRAGREPAAARARHARHAASRRAAAAWPACTA